MHTKGFTKALWDLFVNDSPQKDFSNIWTWRFPVGEVDDAQNVGGDAYC